MYTNTELVGQQLQRDLTQYEEDLLTTLIPAIDLWIDRELGSTFIEKESTETRYFDIEGKDIAIDPCTEISTVKLVNWDRTAVVTYTANQQYLARPLNETVKREIQLRWCPIHQDGALEVVAKFSEYDEGVPEDIQIAATRIASALVGRSASGAETSGVVKESIEGYSVDYGSGDSISYIAMSDPIVKSILESRGEPLI
jgi:hypothetical protein